MSWTWTARMFPALLPNGRLLKRASDAGVNVIDGVAHPVITNLDKIVAKFPVRDWGRHDKH